MFKKIRSRMLSGLLVLTMVFSMASPALAAEESGEETVAAETVEAAAETESEETGAETDAETETGDAAEDTETFTETEEVTVTVDDDSDLEELLSSMADNDELFDSYVSQLFYGGRSSYANYGYRLFKNDEINYPIYLALREQISAIAAGTQTSTQITIDLSDYGLTYTADELGIEASSETTELKSYGTAALGEDLLYGKIVYCLLVDCPYEMYWFSKTSYSVGWSMSFSGTSSAYTSITFTSITFNFPVISDYQDSTAYTLSTSGVERAQTAVENAQQIVGNHDSESDEDKLTSYRDEICDLVTYNTEAATDEYKATYGYGDPWGLVYVFDEDDTTNVVCEGYSKAFQYLCDLGLSEETVCYTVTGTMTGGTGSGGHM
ncbi:MAG: hypothetical protein LUE63_09515, partial [Lachnospiraceae bacterium]|nr:hypothetical protein [Lachnospiraceae bacterium]